ncbi:MAG: DUF58 domain-containing protein [Chloroflexota bacterium]
MKKHTLLILIIYTIVLSGLVTRNGQLLILAIPPLVYLGIGLLHRPEKPQLTLTRHLSAIQVAEQEPVTIELSVINQGPTIEEVFIEDQIPAGLTLIEGYSTVLTTLSPGATITLTYMLQGPRGAYHFPGVQTTIQERLGLFTEQIYDDISDQLLIVPQTIRLKRVAIRPRQTRVYAGQIPARQGGPGVEFFGLRHYQPGDPLRWVNARATARHTQNLFVNEFEQERMADVGLILDARQQSEIRTSAGSLFDHSAQATAALGEAFLTTGNRVGLFIYGRYLDWTFPGYGKMQQQRILQALAKTQIGSGEVFATLEHLPTRLFPARSQLVFISPLLSHDMDRLIMLRARGYKLLVISPNPIRFEQQQIGQTKDILLAARVAHLERALLLNKLRQADIQVIDWPVDTPFYEIAHASLSRTTV